VGRDRLTSAATAPQEELYQRAAQDLGGALDRLAAGYEANPDKRHDLRQEIHLQLWRSLKLFDGRCSLRTWTLRVAHNTAVSWVSREKPLGAKFVSIEDIEQTAPAADCTPDIDRRRASDQLHRLIRELKPLDRQIMISWLEELDAAAIAEITGLSPENVAMKIHRIRNVLSRRFLQERQYV
jgi:RNA polymerase sigma-70 factor, ECF subfamily